MSIEFRPPWIPISRDSGGGQDIDADLGRPIFNSDGNGSTVDYGHSSAGNAVQAAPLTSTPYIQSKNNGSGQQHATSRQRWLGREKLGYQGKPGKWRTGEVKRAKRSKRVGEPIGCFHFIAQEEWRIEEQAFEPMVGTAAPADC